MNKLVIIGRIGHFRCYLNVSEEEAKERYEESEGSPIEELLEYNEIYTMEFEDEFESYKIWEVEND